MGSSSIMESFFQRSLEDLIKGIRLHSPDLSSSPISTFLSKSLDEIRKEIKSMDPHTKSTALFKLIYLHSIHGFDISWASFHVVEVISSPLFLHKKIGYLGATFCFHEGTNVILLVTNQFKKDLSSVNDFEVCLALECLSVIGTHDLCCDLCGDVFRLLSSTRVFVKKKAVAVCLRLFSKYPDAVRVCFKRLVENLESGENLNSQCVVSSVVGVFCELTLRDPKAYLPLAPEFYRVLVDCKNNWVLIKVLKIFAKLVGVEPRLGKKIVGPICEIMERTMAKSLLFECIRTVVSSLSEYESAVKLAASKIREFLGEDDPNLKYLGLQALSDVGTKHLWMVLENKDVVLKSLSDVDPNIKLASLRLLMTMASEDNVAEICRVLVNYALKSDPEFCNEILRSMLVTCSRNYYEIVVDFDWYVSLLGEMARVPHCLTGEEIESQLVDIGMRVKDARPELAKVGRDLLSDPALLGNPFLHGILSAAAWVCGEFVEFSKNPIELIEALLQPRTSLLPQSARAVYIMSTFKVLVFCLQSFLWQRDEAGATSLASDLTSLQINFQGGLEFPESSDVSMHGTIANSEQVSESSIRASDRSSGNNRDDGTLQDQSSLPISERDTTSKDPVYKLLDFIERALGPLSWSHEVEVQERARNVLGAVQLVKLYMLSVSGQLDDGSGMENFEISEITKFFDDLFEEVLGPVSVNAQARVPVPDDLTLMDNLSDLDTIFSDLQLTRSTSFTLEICHSKGKDDAVLSNGLAKEDLESSASGTLLSEHRKRHGLYYLPSEKDDTLSNDYPPANESKNVEKHVDEMSDLVKLTEQSLTLSKKPNRTKSRPVVVKLDEGENFIPAKKLEIKEDVLSGAVRDVLLGSEEVSTSSKYTEAGMSSTKSKGKETLVDGPWDLPEHSEAGDPSSRRSKQKHRSKEKQRSHGESGKVKEERSDKEKKKSSRHHHSRRKEQEKGGDFSSTIQTPQIPDFLL